jgi:glycosyltransferase involved in cell wall biosynthesis
MLPPKSKILLLNQDWLQKELIQRGYEVFSASITNQRCDLFITNPGLHISELFSKLPSNFIPDRIIYWDDSTVPWCVGLEELEIPKLFYAVDTHQHFQWHPQFSAVFDKTLVAHKDFLHLFANYSDSPEWVPLWATRGPHLEKFDRDLEVVFVGTIDPVLHPDRTKFFEEVGKRVPLTLLTGDYLEPYSKAKIVLNQVVNRDLNFRVFEALTCGALLVTPRIENGLPKLFSDQEEIICYEDGNAVDAAEKVLYYLKNEAERQRIANAGNRKALLHHQSGNRVETILAELNVLQVRPSAIRAPIRAPIWAYGAAFSYLAGFLTCHSQGIPWGKELFKQGLSALLQARNLVGKEQSGAATIYAYYQKELNGGDAAVSLLRSLRTNSPDNPAFPLLLIKDLLTLGRRDEAEKEASLISATPENVCMQIDNLLAKELA